MNLIDIAWENIFLHLTIAASEEGVTFYLSKSMQPALDARPADSVVIEPDSADGETRFKLNICQMEGRAFLDNGDWAIYAEKDGAARRVAADAGLPRQFAGLARIFPYAEGKTYSVWFSVDEKESSETALYPVLHSRFQMTDDDWKYRFKGAKGAALSTARSAYSAYAKGRSKEGNLLFLSQTKDRISGNLAALDKRLKERGLDQKLHIQYYFHDEVSHRPGKAQLLKLLRLIAGQRWVVVDDFVPIFSYIDPPEGTQLIQLWHAGVGFKSVGYSRFGKTGSPHPAESYHRKYAFANAPSEEAVDVYREVFGIEKEAFLTAGMPRLDGFTDSQRIESFREQFFKDYPELQGRKLVLFAPTYRGAGQKDAYYDYSKIDQEVLAEALDGGAVLVKMHPFIKERFPVREGLEDCFYDFSDYPDINALYYIADLLITDYSSCYYEYALLGKPVLFYTYDRLAYQALRGVHRDVAENAPGRVCDTFAELLDAVRQKEYDYEKTEAFRKAHAAGLERNAADVIIDAILNGGKHE